MYPGDLLEDSIALEGSADLLLLADDGANHLRALVLG